MNPSVTQQQPGIPCPDCGTLIPVTITQLLGASDHYTCSCCGRILTLMRRESATALKELATVDEARKNLDRQSSRFNR